MTEDAFFDRVVEAATTGLDLGLPILEKVRDKLIIHPDPAAERLCAVLSQLRAMYSALDEKLSSYAGIMLWEDMPRIHYARQYEALAHLSPASLQARFAEARAHCSTIKNIYETHLENWFQRCLNAREQDELRNIFLVEMDNADSALVEALDQIANWLGHRASILKVAMDNEDWERIGILPARTRPQAEELQTLLAEPWLKLAELRAAFMKATGATITG
jgi:hypothetical protein